MDLKIRVSVRDTYGVKRIYPECEISRALARIANQKTLTLEQIEIAKSMGYGVEVITPSLENEV